MSKIVDDAIIKQLRGGITQEQLIAILTEQGVIRPDPDPSTIKKSEQSDKVSLKFRSIMDEWTRTDEMYVEWRNEWKKIRRDTPEAKGRLKGNRRK